MQLFKILKSKNIIVRGIAMVLILLNSLVLTNYFGLELLGVYTTFVLYIGLSSQLFSLSFNSYALRVYSSVDLKDVGVYVFNNSIFQFLSFLLCLIIFKSIYPEVISKNYILFGLLLFFTASNAIIDNLFTGIGKPVKGAYLLIVRSLSILIFVIINHFFNSQDLDLYKILLISIILSELSALLIFSYSLFMEEILNSKMFKFDLDFIRKGLISGTKLTIYSFLFLLTILLPRIILTLNEGDLVNLGKYQINFLLTMAACNLLESSYSTSRLSELVPEMMKNKKINILDILSEIKFYLVILVCFALLMIMLTNKISQYINGVDLISILILSSNALLYFTYRSFYYRIYAGAYDRYLIVMNIIITIFSASSLYFLNSFFGYTGILLSTVINSFVMVVVSLWFIKNKINVSRV